LTDDQLFEDHPHLLDLQSLAIGYQPDARATVRFAADQSLLIQPNECGTDRRPAGVQPKREIGFDQALVGVEATADDLTPQALVDLGAAVRSRRQWRPMGGRRGAPRWVGDGWFHCATPLCDYA
jgi:hypothetical protein